MIWTVSDAQQFRILARRPRILQSPGPIPANLVGWGVWSYFGCLKAHQPPVSRIFSWRRRMSESVAEHRALAPQGLRLAVVTVSDTRTIESDTSGALAASLAAAAGHDVVE